MQYTKRKRMPNFVLEEATDKKSLRKTESSKHRENRQIRRLVLFPIFVLASKVDASPVAPPSPCAPRCLPAFVVVVVVRVGAEIETFN